MSPRAGRRSPVRSAALCALGGAALTLVACTPSSPPPQDVAARIGGEEIRYQSFERYLARNVGEGDPQLGDEALSRLFDQFLDEELLVRLAVDSSLVPEDADRRQALEAQLARIGAGEVADADVEAYYRAHQEEFRRPERVRLRQILVSERALAERALADLRAGESFESVSRRLSDDPAAAAGGVQGELAFDDLPPAFAEVVFELEPGELSPIVAAEYGHHIFQVTDRLPAELVPLAVAAPSIRERLARRTADERLASLLADARRGYNVEIFERNLPFTYRGSYVPDAQADR